MVSAEDVGAEVFAGDGPASRMLNKYGALRRKSAPPLGNLTQILRVKSKGFGHTREATMLECISSDVHDRHYIA